MQTITRFFSAENDGGVKKNLPGVRGGIRDYARVPDRAERAVVPATNPMRLFMSGVQPN